MRLLVVSIFSFALLACDSVEKDIPLKIQADVSNEVVPWTSLEPVDSQQDFHFVVVTDRTGNHRPGVFSGAMPKVNLMAPAFVVSVGDLIEGYTENQSRLDQEWDEMEGFISQLEAPFFYVAGNHDMNNAVMAETWQRRFGPSFYHFKYKGVLFLVLNSELFGMVDDVSAPVPGPWTQTEQMQFIERVLSENTEARWTVVLIHQPLWDLRQINADWLKVEAMLGERKHTVFAGHFHRYSRQVRQNRDYITLATTGGGSGLRGPIYGEFDHVAWVTMTEDGPRIANLALDGIHDVDVSNPKIQAKLKLLDSAVEILPENSVEVESEGMFSRSSQGIRISNPLDHPITVNPWIKRPGNFDITGLASLNVPANESRELLLTYSSAEPSSYKALNAAGIEWRISSTIDQRPVEAQTVTALMPVSTFSVPFVTNRPEVDGDLSDWDDLSYAVEHQGDVFSEETMPEDISFAFDLKQDKDSLFIAVDVTDDSLVSDTNLIARYQDTIVISIDSREEELAENKWVSTALFDGTLEALFMTMQTVEPASKDTLLEFMEADRQLMTSETARTGTGYRTELAVPHAVLNEMAGGKEWKKARISISVYDFDEGEPGNVILHWKPYRFGSAPVEGTHLFTRE